MIGKVPRVELNLCVVTGDTGSATGVPIGDVGDGAPTGRSVVGDKEIRRDISL